MAQHLEVALPAGADPRRHARALARMWEAVQSGDPPPGRPRPVISASWQRMRRLGVDPDHGRVPEPLDPAQVQARREESGLASVLPILRDGLVGVAEQAAHIMVVVDTHGAVLWREGSSAVRRRADGLGFMEGMCWHENVVGTNAIGTSLVAGEPIQVYSAEHFVRTHHPWTCSAAPVRDPRDGRLLGAVDLSGPAPTVHPTTLALVDAVARLAETSLRTKHLADLDRLRAYALPLLSKVSGRAVVVDRYGWVAAATGVAPGTKISLPATCEPGRRWLPSLGGCVLEPLPEGWLVRPSTDPDAPIRVVLDLRAVESTLTVETTAGSWTRPLSPRHAQILELLALRREGRSAAQLAGDLFGDDARTVTVRAEMSRLRRNFGEVLARRPYRFADGVEVVLTRNGHPASAV